MNRFLNSVKYLKNWYAFWEFYYKAKNNAESETIKFTPKMKSDIQMVLPDKMIATFDEVFLREIYRKRADHKEFPKDPLILDIGANVGYFTLNTFMKFPFAKIYAFEPMPVNLKLLRKHAELNSEYDLTIVESAVFSQQEKLTMNYVKNDLYTTGASAFERKNTNATIEVQAITLEDIFEKYQLEMVDLVKIDCEGAEYDILYNCPDEIFGKIKYLTIEAHNWIKGHNINDLQNFLQTKGYHVINRKDEILYCQKMS